MDHDAVLNELMEGNRRFVAGAGSTWALDTEERRVMAQGQSPIAVILGCSDSRVPTEIIFDQGPGRLFVVRVAGNIVNPTQIGSVEYAVEQLGATVVMVLGHEFCGAVTAAIETRGESLEELSHGMQSLLRRIRPALQRVGEDMLEAGGPEAVHAGVEANVHESVEQLSQSSDALRSRVESGELSIVGATYSLNSGQVTLYG